jgi:hypothetical protein
VTPAIVDGWLDGDGAQAPDPASLRRETAQGAQDARDRAFALFDRLAARWPD